MPNGHAQNHYVLLKTIYSLFIKYCVMKKYTSFGAALLWVLAAMFVLAACNNDDDAVAPAPTVSLTFDLDFNGQPFTLNTEYTTQAGEALSFSHLRFWVSNVALEQADGALLEIENAYYLVEQTATSQRLTINLGQVPAGNYTGIQFGVGVDPLANSSLDQKAGELDETIGMSWTWATGYKFLNAEGSYFNTQRQEQIPFRVHIGTDDNYKAQEFTFANALSLENGKSANIAVGANAEQIFTNFTFTDDTGVNGAEPELSFVMLGNPTLEARIANNYAAMFTLTSAAVE